MFDYSYDGVMRSVEFSLERTGLDGFDILFAHDLDVFSHGSVETRDHYIDQFINGGYKACLAMREQGVIKALGAGVNEWQACRMLAERGDMDLFLLAGRYTLLEQEPLDRLLPMCVERGIGIVLGGAFNSGILATGPVEGAWYNYNPAPPEIIERVRKLEAVCKRHGVRLIEAALQFPLAHPALVTLAIGPKHPAEARSGARYAQCIDPVCSLGGPQGRRSGSGRSAGSGKRAMIVDAHHHLWHPARGDYGWMPPDDPVLSRPYRLAEAETTFRDHGVGQSVIVQAAPTVAETDYMLGIADSSDIVAGVVGWIDFEEPADRRHLERFAGHPKFRSVRPMVQDIADDDWLLRPGIRWAFDAIRDLDLAFDALGFPRHASRFLDLFQRRPELRVVIDHCLKPAIRDGEFDGWARDMERIARETSAAIKLSGLVTEAGADCSIVALKPYVDHVLASFGAGRVMWGSDWPVCRLRAEYGDWLASAKTLTSHLGVDAQTAIFGTNAQSFYRLPQDGA